MTVTLDDLPDEVILNVLLHLKVSKTKSDEGTTD